jgi:hypothetical protein
MNLEFGQRFGYLSFQYLRHDILVGAGTCEWRRDPEMKNAGCKEALDFCGYS